MATTTAQCTPFSRFTSSRHHLRRVRDCVFEVHGTLGGGEQTGFASGRREVPSLDRLPLGKCLKMLGLESHRAGEVVDRSPGEAVGQHATDALELNNPAGALRGVHHADSDL